MSDEQETPTTTHDEGEPLGEGGKKALDSERQARKDAEKALKKLQGDYDALVEKSESNSREWDEKLSGLQADFDESVKAREGLEHKLLVRDVAAEYGLPLELAGRLEGDDEEALREDAERLQEYVPTKARRPQPVPEAGQRSQGPRSTADQFADMMRGLMRR